MEECGTWGEKMVEREQEEEKWERYQPTCTTCDRDSY